MIVFRKTALFLGLAIAASAITYFFLQGYFFQKEEPLACPEKCQSLGFESGRCGELHLPGETGYCRDNEKEIGVTPDCGELEEGGSVVPGGILGCCCRN